MNRKDVSSPNRGEKFSPDEGQQYEGSPQSDEQQYQDQDGDQLEYDPVTKKLVGTRNARKKAEEDVKLLANRIALLKMEEKKAWKKIEDTKKKARDIMQVRQRNQEQQKFKEQRNFQKEMEEKQLQERNLQMKMSMKEGIQMTKEQHQQKLREEAERLKQEKREQLEMLQMQKQQEAMKNASIKQMIKQQESELGEKKKRDQMEKKAKTRSELISKILEENQRRMEVEKEIEKMEKEELELIQKLQNTQLLQKAAYEDLETALSGNASPDSKDFSPLKNGSDSKSRPQTAGMGNQKFTPQNAGK